MDLRVKTMRQCWHGMGLSGIVRERIVKDTCSLFSSEGMGYDSPYSVGTGWECSNLLNGTFEY